MNIPELVITGPDSIAASVPFIIGFTPHNSLVVMWLREGCVRLSMRLDLPPAHVAPDDWVDAVMIHRSPSDEVILCVFPPPNVSPRDDTGELHSRELITALLDQLGTAECHVRDVLLISGERWWSYLCEELECCSPAGTPVDPDVAEAVAARFALAGVARLPDREAVVAICAADPVRQEVNRRGIRQARRARSARLARTPDPRRAFETWRDEAIAVVRDSLCADISVSGEFECEILLALGDVRVRDTVLWEMANSELHDAHRAFERAADLLRGAPTGAIAPVGSVAAILGWLIGDGVRAMAALDRVQVEDPDYPLAELLRRSISAGLPPSGWIEMMRGLGREACRGTLLDSPQFANR